MTKHDFADFARDLSAYYGRQAFTPDRLLMIFPKVEHIPSSALPWIFQHITDTVENIPANIGKALVVGYQTWVDATPGMKKNNQSKECPDCNFGLLFVQRPLLDHHGIPITCNNKAQMFTTAFGCMICGQAPIGIPRKSKADLITAGWELQLSENSIHREKYKKKNEERKKGIRNLPLTKTDDEFEKQRRIRHLPEHEQEQLLNAPF